MTRMVNDIPLASVLGLIPGFTPIIVENRTAANRWNDTACSSEVWEGLAKDIHRATDEVRYKWMRSKVYEIRQMKDAMMFVICTQYEQY